MRDSRNPSFTDSDKGRSLTDGGKQLGRVVEALQAICENLDTSEWKPEERKAVKSFLNMADDLAHYKQDHQPLTRGDIAALVEAIRSLK